MCKSPITQSSFAATLLIYLPMACDPPGRALLKTALEVFLRRFAAHCSQVNRLDYNAPWSQVAYYVKDFEKRSGTWLVYNLVDVSKCTLPIQPSTYLCTQILVDETGSFHLLLVSKFCFQRLQSDPAWADKQTSSSKTTQPHLPGLDCGSEREQAAILHCTSKHVVTKSDCLVFISSCRDGEYCCSSR